MYRADWKEICGALPATTVVPQRILSNGSLLRNTGDARTNVTVSCGKVPGTAVRFRVRLG